MTRSLPFRLPFMRKGPKRSLFSITTEEDEQRYKPIEWPLIRRLLGTLAPYKWRYVLGLSLGLTQIVLEMLSPRFMQRIINYVASFSDNQRFLNFFTRYSGMHLPTELTAAASHAAIVSVIHVILLWGGVFAVALYLQRMTMLIMIGAGERVQFDLRRALFEHLQKLSMSYYDRTKLGRIISRCTSDINSLREINVWGIHQVLANSLMMIVAASMLLLTSWQLFLSVAWLGVVLLIANREYRKRSGYMWQVVREGFTRVATNLAENITGTRVVTAFNRQEPNLNTFNALQDINTSNNMELARVNGIYQPLLQFIGFVGKVIILAFGGYLIVSGKLQGAEHAGRNAATGVGAVVAAFMYWDWFMNPIINFGNFSNQLMQAMAGAERVFNLLDTKPDVTDVPGAMPLARIEGRVTFENVTFGYHPDRPVLHEVSFEASPGQMIALVGATGSGKSSIVSLIARFYQPQKGRVLVDGTDIRNVIGETLHRQTGLVLQVNYLFTGTVMENIRYGREHSTNEQVITAAREIGSYDAIMQLAKGFETEVGERGGSMSLGQRQLICFTRAYLADPRIFMLDEATSAVDTGTEQIVQQSLERLLAGRTTFIVAHRLSTIVRADCILVIDGGRIIERGTHRQLVAAGGKYSHLYEQFVQHSE